MKSFRLLLTSILASLSLPSSAAQPKWPPLPQHEFITGRAATNEDVEAGTAAISFRDGEKVVGEPIELKIPQYAYYTEGGKKDPVVVIQAERFLDRRFIGARLPDGRFLVGFFEDFQLLGTTPPAAGAL